MFKQYFLKCIDFIKQNYAWILLLLLFIFFFTFPVLILYDSAHYMSFVEIFEGKQPFSSWDIVRGPVFPIMIFLSNKLFGKTSIGLLFMYFFYYVIMLFVSKYILDFLSLKSKKTQIALYVLFFLLVILNPIIFGYYHSLLTEGIAISFALLSSLCAWKLLTFSKEKNPHFLLLAFYFILMTPISWFLKQPYLSTVIFPLGVAAVIQLFTAKEVKQKLSVCLVVVFSLFSLFLSMRVWNVFLQKQDIDLNTTRNISKNFGNQLLYSIRNLRIETDENGRSLEVQIVDREGKVIGVETIEKNESSFISTRDSILFILKVFVKYPLSMLDSYFANYLALINIYNTFSPDGVGYFIKDRTWDLDGCVENCVIAISVLDKKSNIYYMPDEMYVRVEDYEQYMNTPPILRIILRLFVKPSILIFNISFLLLPFVLVFTIVYWFVQRKKIDVYIQKIFTLSIILLSYSFLHLLLHTVTGAIIDRYATPAYITTILGYMCLCVVFWKSKGSVKDLKKVEKSRIKHS